MHVESSLPETVVIEVLTFYKNFWLKFNQITNCINLKAT